MLICFICTFWFWFLNPSTPQRLLTYDCQVIFIPDEGHAAVVPTFQSKICRELRDQHFLGFFAINEEIYAGFCFQELLDQFGLADPAPSCEYDH